mmetsp:Transcript_51963/g.111152  ORF Transcript_51963/g.111152 Transcript_51963/m.111152 type:complete len:439 (+) Transcript_51963:1670-2986(+)
MGQQHQAAESGCTRDGVCHGHERGVQSVLHAPNHLVARRTRQGEGAKEMARHTSAKAHESGAASCDHGSAAHFLHERANLLLLYHRHLRLGLGRCRLRWGWHGDILAVLGADDGAGDDVALLTGRQGRLDAGEEAGGLLLGADVAKEVGQVLGEHGRALRRHAASKVGVANDRHTVLCGEGCVLLCHVAVAAAHGCKVDDDRARLHVLDHVGLDEHGTGPSRDGRCGDDDIDLLEVLMEGGLLSFLKLLAAFLGVTAFARATLLEVNGDPRGTHGLDLVADIADVPGAHDGAHCLGGADGRQSRHSAAEDHRVGRRVLPRCGHFGGEEPLIDVGRLKHGAVARTLGLRGEHIEFLRDGDARHRREVHEGHTARNGLLKHRLGIRQPAPNPRDRHLTLHLLKIGIRRWVDREEHVVALQNLIARCNHAAGVLKSLVRKA